MSTADEILLDAIMTRHGYTRAEAERAAKLIEKLTDTLYLMGSASCMCPRNRSHAVDCAVVAAWNALDHPRGHVECGRMFDLGREQSPFRSPGYYVVESEQVLMQREPAWGPGPVAELTRAQHFARIVPSLDHRPLTREEVAELEARDLLPYTASPSAVARLARELLARQEAADTDAPVSPPRHETSRPPR